MEVGKRLPSLGVGAGYNYHNLMERSFLDASKGKIDRTFGMVFASVSVPLSDWWGGSHAIKRRKIEQLKAQEQLTDNAQLLKIRMQKAWNDVQEAFQQVALARQGVEQAEENLRLNRDFYKAGTCTMNDLLQAQLLYQQARDKRTDAFAAYQNSLLDYHQAVGRSNFL
jgi:outer membrane protein TolC